jgi:hypothetical protein
LSSSCLRDSVVDLAFPITAIPAFAPVAVNAFSDQCDWCDPRYGFIQGLRALETEASFKKLSALYKGCWNCYKS